MGKFLQQEKLGQAAWKVRTNALSEKAKKDGIYKNGNTYTFCLPLESSTENLFEEIRDKSINYFKNHGIKWHDNNGDFPSSHLCDSQVCCVNFLMPLINSEEVTLNLFKRYFPDITKVLSMDEDSFVSFEWIGKENYLKEKIKFGTTRTRGANCTSVDASIMFETTTGKKIVVLIEWKYSESYSSTSYLYSKNGTDRTTIYQHLWDKKNCIIDKNKVPSFKSLFFEPFYQFTRQQFLAKEMELANELGAEEVYLMHLSPKVNTDFKEITSVDLKSLGNSATDVWKNLVKDSSKFLPLYIEEFFSKKIITKQNSMLPYWNYISERYSTIINNEK